MLHNSTQLNETIQSALKLSHTLQNSPKRSKTLSNAPKLSQMLQNSTKSSKNYSKLSKTLHAPKLSDLFSLATITMVVGSIPEEPRVAIYSQLL